MKVSVNVLVAEWRAPDFGVALRGGVHELPAQGVKLSAGLVRAIAAAAAAGVLELVDADTAARKVLDGAVEPDRTSLKAQAKAMRDGRWQEGNLAQHALEHQEDT